jgi:hypothetical protein
LNNPDQVFRIWVPAVDYQKRNPKTGLKKRLYLARLVKSLNYLSPELAMHRANIPRTQQGVHQQEQHDSPSNDEYLICQQFMQGIN